MENVQFKSRNTVINILSSFMFVEIKTRRCNVFHFGEGYHASSFTLDTLTHVALVLYVPFQREMFLSGHFYNFSLQFEVARQGD